MRIGKLIEVALFFLDPVDYAVAFEDFQFAGLPVHRSADKPSLAVDVAAYPIAWDDRARQTLFAGYVLATAKAMGVDLRWGGDWNRDTEVRDNGFDDLVHFEIME